MAAAALWRWVLLRQLQTPAIGVLWVLLWGLVPLVELLKPIPSARGGLEAALAWSFPAGLIGASLGLLALSPADRFLELFPARTRWLGEVGGLGLATAYLQVPIWGGALLFDVSILDFARSVPDILCFDFRLAALTLLLLLPPLTTPLRVTSLLAVSWILPAFLADGSRPARALAGWLDAGAGLQSPGSWPSSAACALALLLAGYLLRVHPLREGVPAAAPRTVRR